MSQLNVPDLGKILSDAVSMALIEWEKNIREPSDGPPNGASVIDGYSRDKDRGCGWTWEKKYRRNGQWAWCGMFVGAIYRRLGLHRYLAQSAYPSTYRLARYAKYLPFSKNCKARVAHPLTGEIISVLELHEEYDCLRMVQELDHVSDYSSLDFIPRPGDVLLVGYKRGHYGKHVSMVLEYDEDKGLCATVEGNCHGWLPCGNHVPETFVDGVPVKWAEGVIRREGEKDIGKGKMRPAFRPIGRRDWCGNRTYYIQRIIRPSALDFVDDLKFVR